MALNWDATRVVDVEALHADDKGWEITNALIWGTMSVGYNSITVKNYVDFFARLTFIYALLNIQSDITVADVERRIGLHTNASNETELQFVKRIGSQQLTERRYRAVRTQADIAA